MKNLLMMMVLQSLNLVVFAWLHRPMWSCDFLVQHTVGFRVLYVFVVMQIASRKVIHLL